MQKKIKSIIVSTVTAILLVTSSLPVMAAEQVRGVANTETDQTAKAISSAMLQSYYYSGSLTQGKYIKSVTINGHAKLIKWRVAGAGGNVIFRMTNTSTGDSRSFTTTANGVWGSSTYLTSMDSGTWNIRVEYVSGLGHNQVWLEFYS